ncbi:LacI family DNA-binding transcriptional regulator [Novosphingobium panipatense]|jgi:DNA-binding LacI/PurR family transcriptional regulator|uniref:LacI family DNA-binding transcriptional regulator n=1 Tax=Novosphingobium TaxID=165696 RepID=UPI000CDB44B4|nr:substrate-binding domain-containing protein [Novosphingobium sp. HII-3]
MDKSRGGPNGTDTPETAVEVRTLADLARVAGVSAGTVSRALAGKSLVNIETRERIQVLARQYGFRPNQIASKLRSGRTGVIGVVIPLGPATGQPISDPFFMAILGHLADELTGSGYDIMLSRAIPDGTPDWLERITGSGMVDGVLLIGQSDQSAIIEQVAARYRPLVVWGNRAKGQRHITVGTDSELGGRLGAEHLIACGARRLAFVGDTAGVEIATRLKGARAAAQAAGLTIDHIPADLADERMRSQIGAALIASGADYDGIVAASDVIAMATLHVLHEAGRKVPGDIQLVGFDDLPMAGLTSPPLTTVRQEIAEGARVMVAKLKALIDGDVRQSRVMPPTLVVRETTRPTG